MNPKNFEDDEQSVVFVSLNISQMNITHNGTRAKSFTKTSSNDSSFNTILIGIGGFAVLLIGIAILIQLICKCIQLCKEGDTNEKDPKQSPFIQQTPSRRGSAVRNPDAFIRRSSLPLNFQQEIRQNRRSLHLDHMFLMNENV